jgi:hypothetical protein
MRPSGRGAVAFAIGALVVCCAAAQAQPAAISTTMEFARPSIVTERAGSYDVIRMQDAVATLEVGFPELPLRIVTLALPEGTVAVRADAEVLSEARLDGTYSVRPVQPQVPLSRPDLARWVEPDAAAYASRSPYPATVCALLGNGMIGGRPVATVAVYPIQYTPADGSLTLNETVRIDVTLAPNAPAAGAQAVRRPMDDRAAVERLRALVANPEDVAPATTKRGTRAADAEYLIITSASLAPIFQPLADWKTQKGVPAQILTTAWIYSTYAGVDNQERIRNCIIDYYENHGTTWVLLGGDTSVVPARVVYAMTSGAGGSPDEDDIRCDLYYADLDGTWNADGDGTWGEVIQDAVDMYADLFIGRAPVDNTTEATRFVSKTLTYQGAIGAGSPPTDYQREVLFLAEVLWDTPFTDGGICKDMIDDESVPPELDPITKLYETNGLLTKSRAISEMNAGHNIVNHMGHANYNVLSIGSSALYGSDFDNLANGSRYGIFYSIGCWPAAIDYDAIGEHWVHSARAGVAFVGNSRYGWGSPGNSGSGTSDQFDREFFRQLFNEGVDRIGATHAAHKDALVGLAQTNDYYRYCLYELNLLGDPEMTVWTAEPVSATANHASTVPLGQHPFVVTVRRSGEPVGGAVVHLASAEVSETALTGADGIAVLYPAPTAEGSMTVTVTGQGILPYGAGVAVVDQPADTEPPARVEELVVSDPFDLGGTIELSWAGYAPPADFACYRIYRGAAAFSDVSGLTPITGGILAPENAAWTDAQAENGVPYWYAVTAVDLSGNEEVAVSCRGPIAASQNARILVWDADDGDKPFDGVGDDFTTADGCEAPWIDALDAVGELYVVSETLPADLTAFDFIVYLGGVIQFAGQGGVNVPMTDAEAVALTAFIDGGGSVYVEEPSFGGTYFVSGTPTTIALWSRFHATHAAGSGRTIGNVVSLTGVAGLPSDGQSFAYDYKSWPDQLVGRVGPNGDAGTSRLWNDQSANARGAVYVAPESGARLYMVPVLLGGMTDGAYPSTRAEYVARILTDLDLIGTSGVAETPAVLVNGLRRNAPNPFNPATTIRYSVGRDGARVRLAVYDVTGRLVTVLADGAAEAGEHAARWDGRDAHGRPVSSGVYFCRLTVDAWTGSMKMTLLK